MTWQEHLHGEDWREEDNCPGLIPQLSQRLGLLRKLSSYSYKKKLKMLASGLFYSKLSYCLPLFTSSWGLDSYKEEGTRFTSFTKEDNRKLQVLQNQVCRLLLPRKELADSFYYKQNLTTEDLMAKTETLSIHQLGAQSTRVMTKKILLSGQPSYLAQKLTPRNSSGIFGSTIKPPTVCLTLSREGFLYRSSKLYNLLPEDLRKEDKISNFKKKIKTWVIKNVSLKP